MASALATRGKRSQLASKDILEIAMLECFCNLEKEITLGSNIDSPLVHPCCKCRKLSKRQLVSWSVL